MLEKFHSSEYVLIGQKIKREYVFFKEKVNMF